MRNLVRRIHFLRRHGGQLAAPFVGLASRISLAITSSFFCVFALDVAAAGFAQHATEPALADGRHLIEQPIDACLFARGRWPVSAIWRMAANSSRGRRAGRVASRGVEPAAVLQFEPAL
jgi:hypothetical protein